MPCHIPLPSRQPFCRAPLMSECYTHRLNVHQSLWALRKHMGAYAPLDQDRSTHTSIGLAASQKPLCRASITSDCDGHNLNVQQSLYALQKSKGAGAPDQPHASIGSSSTMALGSSVKTKAQGFSTSGICAMRRGKLHKEAYDQGPSSKISSDTMCKEDVTCTVQHTLAMWDRSFMSGDRSTLLKLASDCIKLAWILLDQNNIKRKLATALDLGQKALKVFESHRPSSLKHASCLCAIGYAYKELGELEKAVEHAEKAAFIFQHSKATHDKKDPLAWKAQGVLVLCKGLLNKPSNESLCHVEKYIKLSEKLSKPGDRDLGLCYQVGGQAYYEADQPYVSLSYCSKALAIFNRHDGSRSPQVALIRHIRSRAYLSLGKYKNSLLECDKARPYIKKAGLEVGDVDLVYVKCLLDLREDKKAILRLKGMLKNYPKTSRLHALALVLLADVYATQKREKKFTKWCKRALDAFENLEPSLKDAALVRYFGKLQEQIRNYEEGSPSNQEKGSGNVHSMHLKGCRSHVGYRT